MPIRPEMRARYPADWPAIRALVAARSGGRCEWCGVRHRDVGWREPDGTFKWAGRTLLDAGFKPGDSVAFADGRTVKLIRIILTVAHVHDHDPGNCDLDNLAHLCQRCHNRHDGQMRRAGIRARAALAAGQGSLFAPMGQGSGALPPGKETEMAASMRAKLRIASITATRAMPVVGESDGQVTQERIVFGAVAAKQYAADGDDEDNTYAKFSPQADLTIVVANPALLGKFAVGETYYLDFTPAESA